MSQQIGGVAHFFEAAFAFPTSEGIGLIQHQGRTCVVRFSCPMESSPPQGTGHLLTSDAATLTLDDGKLTYRGEPVVLGYEYDNES